MTYRAASGALAERVVTIDELKDVAEMTERRWSFDADGALFRLASEARRMKHAHLSDCSRRSTHRTSSRSRTRSTPSTTWCSTRTLLRFLLADDPGADKTIMSGLLTEN